MSRAMSSDGESPPASVASSRADIHTPLLIPDRKSTGEVSTTWTLMNLLKGMIGPGCLALPVAFRDCGLWAGLALIFAVGFLNTFCMRQLVRAAQFLCHKSGKEELDYGHLAKKAFDYGPVRLRYFTNTVICVMQLGIGSVLIVFMATHVQEVLDSWSEAGAVSAMDTRIFMCIILLPVVLLNFIRELRVLGWLSSVANLCMLIAFAIIFTSLIAMTLGSDNHGGNLPYIAPFDTFIVGIGSMLYAFEGQAMVLPMENKMSNPSEMLGYNGVLVTGMSIVTCIYAATGFFGYASYGNEVMGSIAQNFDNSPLYVAVKIMLIISVYVGYGIQIYIVIEMLWPAICRKLPSSVAEYTLLLEYVFRSLLVVVTFLFAIAIPNLEDIIPLVGVTAGMVLAFVVPPLLEIVTFWESWVADEPRWRMALYVGRDAVLITIGIVGLFSGLYVNAQKIF